MKMSQWSYGLVAFHPLLWDYKFRGRIPSMLLKKKKNVEEDLDQNFNTINGKILWVLAF